MGISLSEKMATTSSKLRANPKSPARISVHRSSALSERFSLDSQSSIGPGLVQKSPGQSSPGVGGRVSNSPNSRNSVASIGGNSPGKNRGAYWKQNLFLLQENAPKPRAVLCETPVGSKRPPYYGAEFHGLIDRGTADMLLAQEGEGAYLVRESQRSLGSYTLCMFFNGKTLNYKLYFDSQHFVGEKRFDSMYDLVYDGLICMHMDLHAADYIRKMTDEAIYEESPYSQYQQKMAKSQQMTGAGSPNREEPMKERHASTSSGRSSVNCGDSFYQQKAHKFKSHTFRIPHYCDYCGNFMWGLVQQGLRCEDCGFAAHKKCSEKTLLDCRPDLKYVKRVFSVDLTTLCMAHNLTVPPVVEQCIAEIERRGLETEGIYRISGSHEDIERLRIAYDSGGGENIDLSRQRVEDVNTIAGLLKLYLRLLPQPLITFSVYRTLIGVLKSARNDYDREKRLKKGLEELPVAHAHTLRVLLKHLNAVSERCSANKMTVENLARIFAPTLLCAASPHSALALPQHEHYLLSFLITHFERVFSC